MNSVLARLRRSPLDVAGVMLGCLALTAAFARFAGARDLWYDEMATRTLVTDPSLGHMLRAIADGAENNPPLYETLLRGWTIVAGSSALALRIPTLLAFCAALAVTWFGVRREYPLRAVAVGVFAAFAGSRTIVWGEIASARFYGLLTALAALALVLGARAASDDRPRARLLVYVAIANVLMIYCQVFGLLFSGALAAGTLLCDLLDRRFRWKLYAPYVVSWLLFAPWIPTMLHQAELAKPHNWIAVPSVKDLFHLVQTEASLLPFVVVVVLVLRTFAGDSHRAAATGGTNATSAERLRRRRVLLVLAAAYLCVPLLVFVQSHVGMSVFVPRYMLPAVLGWAYVIADVASGALADGSPEAPRGAVARVGWPLLAVGLALAIYASARFVPTGGRLPTPYASVPVGPEPIVVESGFAFWPLLQVPPGQRPNVTYLLDSATAFAPQKSGSAIQEFKLMRLYAAHGYLDGRVRDSARFLCENPRFYVVDDEQYAWFERHIATDSGATWSTVGTTPNGPLRLVTQSEAARRAQCATASRS